MTAWRACLLLLLWPACRLAFREQPRPQCTTNKQCRSSEICFLSTCVKAGAAPASPMYVELTSKDGTSSQRLVEAPSPRLRFVEANRYQYTGSVSDANTANGVNGRFSLERESLIPGRRLLYSVIARRAGRAEFATQLEPGRYGVLYIPDSDTQPPIEFADWLVEETGRDLPLTYPSSASLTVIRGMVLASETNKLPITARVYATVPGSALTSTAELTDSAGRFSLFLAPGQTSASLQLGPSPSNEFVPHLTLANLALTAETQLDTIYLSDLAASAIVDGRVLGIGPTADQAISGATIIAETTVGASGTFRTGALSGSDGRFSLALVTGASSVPLDYTLTVLPPPQSSFSRGETRYTLQSLGIPDPVEVRLVARSVLSGQVVSADGVKVGKAQVLALSLASGNAVPAALQTLTSDEGRFVLNLDPGRYTVQVRTSVDSRLPWASTVVDLVDSNQTLDITLPRGTLVAGEVVTARDAAVPLTALEWFSVNSGKAQLVARAVTDNDGHFSVVLPEAP